MNQHQTQSHTKKYKSFQEKQEEIKEFFSCGCTKSEIIYQKIIDVGLALPPFLPAWEQEKYRVPGCQSTLYLYTEVKQPPGLLTFFATSDALISKGLAALLIWAYNHESAEVILRSPPHFLEEMGIPHLLSPSRANGLASIYTQMKKEAFYVFATQSKMAL
jgi:cysteine desulfuration protein SufE